FFNFDTFWKNFKSKLGFINWDAINGKNQIPSSNVRALLYFRRLWEDFKHNTPYINWKFITEDADEPSLQKRSGGSDQSYNQQSYPSGYGGQYPAKGGQVTTSSAAQAMPDLLQWMRFW
uniref:Dermokine n=1 Tax=Monodelphis domestica TaxID=13616 RepID=F6VSW5_MONDO